MGPILLCPELQESSGSVFFATGGVSSGCKVWPVEPGLASHSTAFGLDDWRFFLLISTRWVLHITTCWTDFATCWLDICFQLTLLPPPPQVPLEEVHEALGQEDLLHRVQHHRNLDKCHGQGVGVRPHGRYQRNPKTLRLRRAAETDSDRLRLGHLPDSNPSPQHVGKPLTGPRIRDVAVDGFNQCGGWSSEVKAAQRKNQVCGDIHEDVEDDGSFGELVQSAGLESAGEGRPISW